MDEKKFNFVYVTTNLINGKQYVGDHSTNDLNCKKTINYFGSGRPYLQRALNEYKKENFKKEILEFFQTKQEAFDAQSRYIIKFNTLVPNGYNISPTGGHGTLGAHLSEETINKIRNSQKGKTKISYYIQKYGDIIGVEKYNKYIIKQKESHIGISTNIKGMGHKLHLIKLYGDEEGNKRYDQFIKKQKESHIGKIRSPLSKEHKEKISVANLGKTHGKQSEETKEKRAKKLRGLKRSIETKHRMSLASKGKHKNYDVWNKNKTKLNITKDMIVEIKNLAKNKIYQKEIAKKFNFSISCIARIINGFYDNKTRM